MNVFKLVGVVAIVCLIGAGVRAEEKADNAKLIVGKWTVSKADEGTVDKGATVEFSSDGKVKAVHKKGDEDATIEGTYKVDGDKLTMTMKAGTDERKIEITIKKLTKTELHTENSEGKKVELTKKS
jgi:uncharacterized protein (TIGR03066 family)